MAVTLIFPAVTPAARDYYRQALLEGRRVIAAASVEGGRSEFGEWEFLPSIHDTAFPGAFIGLVQKHGVTSLYVPVPSVFVFLQRFISERLPALKLVNRSPFDVQADLYRDLVATVDQLMPFERMVSDGKSRLTREGLAGILRQAMLIHGESNEEKLVAMMGAFASLPKGDVVEVGSLMGRTAAVLRLVSERYDIGPVLTVDPWDEGSAVQHDSPKFIQDMAGAWAPGVLPTGFAINMLGLGGRNHAHLTLSSAAAHAVYARERTILGLDGHQRVSFSGKIAVLHIDANHDYDAVSADWQLWGAHLLPGAWLILDDYVWMHGAGPRRLGDELLARGLFERAFVCGKALFMKVRESQC